MSENSGFPVVKKVWAEGVWPSFSRDGRTIVFATGINSRYRRLVTMDAVGASPPVPLTPPDFDASRPSWSWSPATIAFVMNGRDIYTIDSNGRNLRPFLPSRQQDACNLLHPAWCKDLKSIIVVGMIERPHGRESVIYKISPDERSGTLEALTRFPDVCAGRPTVSPDGLSVAFAGNARRCDQERNQVWIVTPPGAARRLEPEEPVSSFQGRSPSWSPDGRWIAFVSTRPAAEPSKATPKAIWVISASGGQPYQITDSTNNPANVEWSRDQRRIVFGSFTHGIGVLEVPEEFLPDTPPVID